MLLGVVDGWCLIIRKKKHVARRQRGYLHIKGGVPGTFEDQTSNGAVRGEVRWLAAFFCLDLE